MKKQKQFITTTALLLVAGLTLLSFTYALGGDSFQIYLGKKLLLQEYVYKDNGIKTISLEKSDWDKELEVTYKHCGVIGKSRTITIKDAQNRVIRTWQFADDNNVMKIKVKDIFAKKVGVGKLNLVYASKEMQGGKLLAGIQLHTDATAVR